jgi:hypothetical protein
MKHVDQAASTRPRRCARSGRRSIGRHAERYGACVPVRPFCELRTFVRVGDGNRIRARPTQALQLAILRAELPQLSAWTGGAVWRQVLCPCALTQIHAEADRVEEALDARRRSPRGPRGLLRARDPTHPGDRLVSASCAGGAQVPDERAEDFQSSVLGGTAGRVTPQCRVLA